MSDQAKQRVGREVAGWVRDGMVVGLGTGSTAVRAIEALGARVRDEDLRLLCVATSFFAERAAREAGLRLATLEDVEAIDLAFDGADEVSPEFHLIKGRGAAHTREKVVEASARRFVVLVDDSKLVDRLGTRFPVPVEVLPMACPLVMRRLRALGAEPELRIGKSKDGPAVTDQGFWVVDARFEGGIEDPAALDRAIHAIPGVLEHGLFIGMATDLLIGHSDGRVEHRTA